MGKFTDSFLIITLIFLVVGNQSTMAEDGETIGSTLLQAPHSRPAALAEAYTSVRNDIGALAYNPASLGNLENSQASFLYHKGLFDDFYANLSYGKQLGSSGLGLNIGLYDGGSIDAFDGVQTVSVTAQKDMAILLGYGGSVGSMNWGLSGKYFSTDIAEAVDGSAVAVDGGLQGEFMERFSWGAAIQNVGRSIDIAGQDYDLPLILRGGLSTAFPMEKLTGLFLVDIPYNLEAEKMRPAAGGRIRDGAFRIARGIPIRK